MKTQFYTGIVSTMLIFSFFFTVSCRSSEENETPPPQTAGFFWRENSPTAALKSAGSSEVRTAYKSIFAFVGTTATSGTVFEINLSAVAPGTYSISGTNVLYFNGNTSAPASGEIVISQNANGKASGTFTATWTSGAITSVYGTFTDIPVN